MNQRDQDRHAKAVLVLEELPEALANERKARGLSYRETGEQIGVSAAAMCKFEKRQRVLEVPNVVKILSWLSNGSAAKKSAAKKSAAKKSAAKKSAAKKSEAKK